MTLLHGKGTRLGRSLRNCLSGECEFYGRKQLVWHRSLKIVVLLERFPTRGSWLCIIIIGWSTSTHMSSANSGSPHWYVLFWDSVAIILHSPNTYIHLAMHFLHDGRYIKLHRWNRISCIHETYHFIGFSPATVYPVEKRAYCHTYLTANERSLFCIQLGCTRNSILKQIVSLSIKQYLQQQNAHCACG